MWFEIAEMVGTVGTGSPWVPILFDAALKGVVVLGLAAVATLPMRRFSAAARHLVWCLSVASLPALPILSAVSPDWYVLPQWMAVRTNLPDQMSPATVLEPRVPPEPAGPRDVVLPRYPGEMAVGRVEPAAPQPVPPNVVEQPETERPAAAALPRPPAGLIDRAPVSQAVPWQVWGLLAWCAGTVVVFMPVGLGMLSLWRLRCTAERISDGPWLLQLEQLSVQLGISRRTILLRSDRRSMPMHRGILQAKLLLPAVADEWSEDRRRVVLLHELAHVRRRDCLTQLTAQVACALYWFNPLVWVALWRMRIECEAACDDLILRTGYRPPDYAEHLLEIVSGLRANGLAAYGAIAMARRSRLEGRLRAILDRGRNRRTLTRTAIAAIVLLLAGAVVPVAMMRAAVAENDAGEERTVQGATTPRESAAERQQWPKKQAKPDSRELSERLGALIEQLGDDEFARREAAQQELVRMGIPAVAAIKGALEHKDAEIAGRARRILAEINRQIEAQRQQHRQAAEAAVERSDRVAATQHYRALLALPEPSLRDCREASRFFEAGQDWASFAMAQEVTAQSMRRVIHTPVEQFVRPAPPADSESPDSGPIIQVQTELDGQWSNGKGTAESWIPWLKGKQERMVTERFDLLLALGRLYRERLRQPDKAAGAFTEALADVPFCTEPLEKLIARHWPVRSGELKERWGTMAGNYVTAMHELSEMQQEVGDLDAAVETKTRKLLMQFHLAWNYRDGLVSRSARELYELLRLLPADAPLPPLFWLNVLSPQRDTVTLKLSKPEAQRDASDIYDPNVVARPGYVFDTLEVTADMESQGRGGVLACYTVLGSHTTLGQLRWDGDGGPGRRQISGSVKVPPEAGLIRFEVLPRDSREFRVHQITVKATFRPSSAAAGDAPAAEPSPGAAPGSADG